MKNAFKKIVSVYYELTVIPAIVLSILTNLGWLALGRAITQSDTIFSFAFFLFIMTIEDVIRLVIKRVKK